MEKNLKGKGRKLYKKPLLEHVELKPEEAVLTGCKVTAGATGPAGKNPICAVAAQRCRDLGS
jgi:hypothetical protein